MKIPKIKKKIESFLKREEGKISKEKLLKTGILVGLIGLSAAKHASAGTEDGCPLNTDRGGSSRSYAVSHCNDLDMEKIGPVMTTAHNHGVHSSY